MKIQKINLSDAVLKEDDHGNYEMVYENEKTYPAALTNHSLKVGKEQGLLKGSLIQHVLGLAKLEKGDAEEIDDLHMLSVIYLAFLGMNRTSNLSFEDFLEKYHYSMNETIDFYADFTQSIMDGGKNKFAEGLKKSTANSKGK